MDHGVAICNPGGTRRTVLPAPTSSGDYAPRGPRNPRSGLAMVRPRWRRRGRLGGSLVARADSTSGRYNPVERADVQQRGGVLVQAGAAPAWGRLHEVLADPLTSAPIERVTSSIRRRHARTVGPVEFVLAIFFRARKTLLAYLANSALSELIRSMGWRRWRRNFSISLAASSSSAPIRIRSGWRKS